MKPDLKVIFLDIDGVLNSVRSAHAFNGFPHNPDELDLFDMVAVNLIRDVCDKTGAVICLSSTWRLDQNWADLGTTLKLPILYRTPRGTKERGYEIQDWFNAKSESYNITHWAIVDDDSDMLPDQLDHFVHVDGSNGLMLADYLKLTSLLK